jgi:dipeptidyl-peptidase-4
MDKPKDFDASKNIRYLSILRTRFSAVINGIQQMTTGDATQQGYIVACVDGRGTGFKGADFKKVTQLESTKWRIKSMLQSDCYAFVDKTRIGIFGWSYGFMASNSLFKGNDTLKWHANELEVLMILFYTERYMQSSEQVVIG